MVGDMKNNKKLTMHTRMILKLLNSNSRKSGLSLTFNTITQKLSKPMELLMCYVLVIQYVVTSTMIHTNMCMHVCTKTELTCPT